MSFKMSWATTVAECIGVVGELIKEWMKVDLSAYPIVMKDLKECQAFHTQMIETMNKQGAQTSLEQYDVARDFAFRGIMKYIEVATYWPNPKVQEAAVRLKNNLKQYTLEIAHLPYAQESGYLQAFIADLQKPDNLQYIVVIDQMEVFIERLIERQKAFEEAASKANLIKLQNKNQLSPSKIKNLQIDLINSKILPTFHMLADWEPDKLEPVIGITETIIKSHNKRIADKKETVAVAK